MFHQYATDSPSSVIKSFMYKVYGWMFIGLAITSGVTFACFSYHAELMAFFKTKPFVPMLLLFGQLFVGLGFAFGLKKINFSFAFFLFSIYSAITGVTFSFLLMAYTPASVLSTFIVTCGMFGAMAVYGYFTRADLSSMGHFLIMGVVGLIVGGIVNLFMHSSAFEYLLSVAGVIIFTLLTAYDVQKIKKIATAVGYGAQVSANKMALFGAFQLYLDFILLFQYLLKLMGKEKK